MTPVYHAFARVIRGEGVRSSNARSTVTDGRYTFDTADWQATDHPQDADDDPVLAAQSRRPGLVAAELRAIADFACKQ